MKPRRLPPLNVRRKPRLDDFDDYVPPLGTARAQSAARREFDAHRREILAEDDDRSSPSYIAPVE